MLAGTSPQGLQQKSNRRQSFFYDGRSAKSPQNSESRKVDQTCTGTCYKFQVTKHPNAIGPWRADSSACRFCLWILDCPLRPRAGRARSSQSVPHPAALPTLEPQKRSRSRDRLVVRSKRGGECRQKHETVGAPDNMPIRGLGFGNELHHNLLQENRTI